MAEKITTRRQTRLKKKQEIINLDSESDEPQIISSAAKNISINSKKKITKKNKDWEKSFVPLKLQQMYIVRDESKSSESEDDISNSSKNEKVSIKNIENQSQSQCCIVHSSSESQSEESVSLKNLAPENSSSEKKKPFTGLKLFLMEQLTDSTAPKKKQLVHDQKQQLHEEIGSIGSDQIPSPQPLSEQEQELNNGFKNRPRPFSAFNIEEQSQPKKMNHLPGKFLQLQQEINNDTLMKKTKQQMEQQMEIIQQKRAQRKKQNKKRDYLIQKKFKQLKVGKKKDRVTNQMFNAIEDYFM